MRAEVPEGDSRTAYTYSPGEMVGVSRCWRPVAELVGVVVPVMVTLYR